MRTPESRKALVTLLAFLAIVALIWMRFLNEFPKDGSLPMPGASPTPSASASDPSASPSGTESPSAEISPEPSPTGELYPSAENPAAPIPKFRRLDDEFEKVKTRLTVVNDETKRLPSAPFLLDGCEGESCGFVEDLTLTCESRFMTDPHPKGFLAFTLPPKTQLQKARVFTLVKRVGKARLKNEKKDIPVLSYSSDGDWLTWEDNELGSYSEWRDGNPKRFRAPVRETWILSEDGEGRQGWLKAELPKEGEKAPKCPFRWGI